MLPLGLLFCGGGKMSTVGKVGPAIFNTPSTNVEIAMGGINGYWDMTTPTPTCVATLSGDAAAMLEFQPFPTITGQTVSATGGAIYFASTNQLTPYPAFTDVRAFEIQVTQMDSGALGLTGVICSTDIFKSVLVAYFPTYHGGVWEFLVNNATIDEYLGTGLERAGIKIDGATGNCWFYIDGIQRAAGSGVITDDVVLGITWNGLSSAGSDVFSGEVVTASADMAHDYGCLDWCGNASAGGGGDAVLPTGAAAGYIYEVSVAGTYDGTDFSVGDLAVVRIDGVSVARLGPGATGPQGPQGPAGADGSAGATGPQGPQGDAGATGPQGDAGPTGATGATGATGSAGAGVATGGTSGQVLTKNSGTNYDTGWTTPAVPAGVATGGLTGQVLTKNSYTDYDTLWATPSTDGLVRTGGAAGYVLTKVTGNDYDMAWTASGSNTPLSAKTSAYTVIAGDAGTVINCTSGTFTVSLTAAATLGAGFRCWVWNTSNTVSHVITIDPAGSETIDGATTLLIRRGEGFEILCDGTNWQTAGTKKHRLYSDNAANNVVRAAATGSNSVALGNAAAASGTSSVAFGDGATASGVSAIVLGTGRATTQDSVAIAITDNTTTYGAKNNTSAIAMGYLATASGLGSVAIGSNANASGDNTVVLGQNSTSISVATSLGGSGNNCSGSYGATLGGSGCAAAADYATTIGGSYLVANVEGKIVTGTGAIVGNGACQTGTTTLVRGSTDGTPVVLTTSSGAAGAATQLRLVDNQSMAVTGRVIARRKGSESTTSTAMWTFNAVIRRGVTAASTALVAAVTPTLIAADADASAWTIAVTADTTNGTLAVTATGEASKNIRWVCTLESTEVIYA